MLYIYPSRNRNTNTDDDLEEKDLAISEMKDWFFDNYDDPANFLPYETKAGGYQYLFGGPYELSNVLHEEFSSKYPNEYIESTINHIENEYGSIDVLGAIQNSYGDYDYYICRSWGYNKEYRWENGIAPDYWMPIPKFNEE